MITGLSHLTFSVSNLARSVAFYGDILGGRVVALGPRLAYFDLAGTWIALNEESGVPRHPVNPTYTHVAFYVADTDFDAMTARLVETGVNVIAGRPRDKAEGRSVYFVDPDGHRLEIHTGTLGSRLDHYRRARPEVRIP